jgi:hypothetical protein
MDERAEADRDILIYVPNYYVCNQCDFRFPQWPDPDFPNCPNDGQQTVKMTWVEYAKELETDMKDLLGWIQHHHEKGKKR